MVNYGVLHHDALLEAEQNDSVKIHGRGPVGATSIDIRVERLFRNGSKTPLSGDTWVLEPGKLYRAESWEGLEKSDGFVGEIASRSSWARYGVCCRTISDDIDDPSKRYNGKMYFSIHTMNTTVILRRGDFAAQVHAAQGSFLPLPRHFIERMEGWEKIAPCAELSNDGFILTLDGRIALYQGGTIDPRDGKAEDFKPVEIMNRFEVDKNQFFLAASEQPVRIPATCIGYLHRTNYRDGKQCSMRPTGTVTAVVHGDSPVINPFPHSDGRAVFENRVLEGIGIQKGMSWGTLHLIPLISPYRHQDGRVSRYHGQDGPVTSRGHFDAA